MKKRNLKKNILLSFVFLLSFFSSIKYFNNKNYRKFRISFHWIYFSYGSSKEPKELRCSQSLIANSPKEDLSSEEKTLTETHKIQDDEIHQIKDYLIDFAGNQLGDSWVNKLKRAQVIYWNLENVKEWIRFLETKLNLTHKEIQTSLKNAHVLMGTKIKTIFKKYNFLKDILGEKVMKDEIKKSTTFYTISLNNLNSIHLLSRFGLRVNENILIDLKNLDFRRLYLKHQLFSPSNNEKGNKTQKPFIKINKEIAFLLWPLAKSYVESNLEKHNLNEMTINEWATKYIKELIESSFYILYIPSIVLKGFIYFLTTNWSLTNEEIFHQVLEDPRILFMTEDQLKEISHLLIPYAKAYLKKVRSQNKKMKNFFHQNKKFSEQTIALFHIQSKFKNSIVSLNIHLNKTKNLFSWLQEIGLNQAEIYEFIPQMYSSLLTSKNQKSYPKQPKIKYWSVENLKNLSQTMMFYAREFVIDKEIVLRDENQTNQEYMTAVEKEVKKIIKNIVLKNFRIFDQPPERVQETIEILKGKKPFLVNLEGNFQVIQSRFVLTGLNDRTIHVPLYFTDSEIFEVFLKHATEFSIFPLRLNKIIQLTWETIQHYIPVGSDKEKIQNLKIESKVDQLIGDFVKNFSKDLGTLGFNFKKKDFHDFVEQFKKDWNFENLDLLELMSQSPKLFLSHSDFLNQFFKVLHPKLETYVNRRLEFFYQLQKKRDKITNNDSKNSFKKEVVKAIFERLFSKNFQVVYPILDHGINKSIQQSLDLLEKKPEFLNKIHSLTKMVR